MFKFLKAKLLKLELMWMRKYWETADLQLSDVARDRILLNLGDLREEKLLKVYSAHRETRRFKLGEIYDHLLKATSALDSAKILDAYYEQDFKHRLSIMTLQELTDAEEMTNCVFEFHSLAGYPKLTTINMSYLELGGSERLVEFSKILSKTIGLFDFYPSNEFRIAIDKHWKDSSDAYDRAFRTSTLILRAIYGEKDLIELFDRVAEENFSIPLIDFPKLLDDWVNIREYPLSWSHATL